jgi:hypothetical protein
MRTAKHQAAHAGVSLADLPGWKRRTLRRGDGPCTRRDAGQANRRVLTTTERDGMEFSYHATKGWRAKRTAPPAALAPGGAA